MKIIPKVIKALAVTVAVVSFSIDCEARDDPLKATQIGRWLWRDGVGTSPDSPADWTDPANWDMETDPDSIGYPSGEAAFVDFCKNEPSTGRAVYISIPDDLTLGMMWAEMTKSGSEVYLFGEGTLVISDVNDSDYMITGKHDKSIHFFTDVRFDAPTKVRVNGGYFHGYTSCKHGDAIVNVVGNVYFTFSQQLTSPTETITDFMPTNIHHLQYYTYIIGPRPMAAATGTFTVTEGSAFVTANSGSGVTGNTCSPGVSITSDFFPEGTFVRRVINSTVLELSAAATTSSSSASISFAEFMPQVTQTLACLKNAHPTDWIIFSVARGADVVGATDTFVMDIHDLDMSETSHLDLRSEVARKTTRGSSATIIFRETSKALGTIRFDRAPGVLSRYAPTVQFVGTNGTNQAGLGKMFFSEVNQDAPACRFIVPENVTATVGPFTNLVGTVYKEGTGTLVITSTVDEVYGLSVDEGGLRLAAASDAAVYNLSVAAGASFEISAGSTVTLPSTATFGDGARIVLGKGAVVNFASEPEMEGAIEFYGPGEVKGLTSEMLQSVVLSGGAVLSGMSFDSLAKVATGAYPSTDGPAGDPAFWVDVSRSDSYEGGFTTYKQGTTTATIDTGVFRLNDRRGTDAKYNFATNACDTSVTGMDYPYLPYMEDGYLLIPPRSTDDVRKNASLVWAEPVEGIRSVFVVISETEGVCQGGAILGTTSRVGDTPFERHGSSTSAPYLKDAADCVKNGLFRLNGRPYDHKNLDSSGRRVPKVVEVHPTEGVAVDAFGNQYGTSVWDGRIILCESIVYTNVLTAAERAQTVAYLVKKWCGNEPVLEDYIGQKNLFTLSTGTGGGSLEVAEGDVAIFDGISGSGEFKKSGDGSLVLGTCSLAGAGLCISGGTVTMKSVNLLDASMLPSDPFIHVDATDADSLVTETGSDDSLVTTWSDTRGGPVALQSAARVTGGMPKARLVADSSLGGKYVVDFGETVSTSTLDVASLDVTEHIAMLFYNGNVATNCPSVCAYFSVHGSANGGGALWGPGFYGTGFQGQGFFRSRQQMWNDGSLDIPIIACNCGCYTTLRGKTCIYSMPEAVSNLVEVSFDGVRVDQHHDGFTGTNEVITWISPYKTAKSEAWSIGPEYRALSSGGFSLGEMMMYDRGMMQSEVDRINAYLMKKWRGADNGQFVQAQIGTLEIAGNATLKVEGGAPVSVRQLKISGGTIAGGVDFALNEGSVADIVVAISNGAIVPVTVSGTVDLSAGGVVTLNGDLRTLPSGFYTLVSSPSISSSNSSLWSVESSSSWRNLSVVVSNGALLLRVGNPGFTIIMR